MPYSDEKDESPERDERLTTTDWEEVKDLPQTDSDERAIRIDED